RLLSSSSASPTLCLQRLLSVAAPAASPSSGFAVEEYLVAACGLTRAQALKASAKLSHLKSPANPDAVLAFFDGLGLSSADVAALVAKDPRLLCASVERTLAPIVVGLSGHGLSHAEIARLFSLGLSICRCRSAISNLPYYLSLLGSTENLVRFLKRSYSLLGSSLEKVVKPNVALLRKCGLRDCDISKLCLSSPWVLKSNTERVVACAEVLGVPRGSRMFRYVLEAVAFLGEEKIAAKVDYLKNTFRWSDAELAVAVSKLPAMLKRSNDMLQSRSEFLIFEVGLEPAYIAHRPSLLSYSLERRLRPRFYALKFLKKNGLLKGDRDYYEVVMVTEKVYMEKYISPHKEAAPHLAQDYANACRGEVPARFMFA
ncbi:transcription termination factor MTEF18, mitochondrial-like, partial [Lolium perenne]|uniref:transcription termination factor MTEF18, mitochondrial-like n=1 Tax=Lolium perenne TaxID=4522 RepID=UPI003A99B09F